MAIKKNKFDLIRESNDQVATNTLGNGIGNEIRRQAGVVYPSRDLTETTLQHDPVKGFQPVSGNPLPPKVQTQPHNPFQYTPIEAQNAIGSGSVVRGNGMTVGQYIAMQGGQTPDQAYNSALLTAMQDYDRQLATYGAQAEAMGRQGLTGSGLSNYRDQAAYGSMQQAKVAADAIRQQMQRDYTAQTAQYNAEQAQIADQKAQSEMLIAQQKADDHQNRLNTALDKGLSMGLKGDALNKYISSTTGVPLSEAADFANGITEVAPTMTGYTSEQYDDIVSQISQLVTNGMDYAAAAQYLKDTGRDPTLVDDVSASLLKAQEATVANTQQANYDNLSQFISDPDKMASALGLQAAEGEELTISNVLDGVDSAVESGQLSKDQGDSIRQGIISREMQSYSGDKNAIAGIMSLVGNTLGTDDEEFAVKEAASYIADIGIPTVSSLTTANNITVECKTKDGKTQKILLDGTRKGVTESAKKAANNVNDGQMFKIGEDVYCKYRDANGEVDVIKITDGVPNGWDRMWQVGELTTDGSKKDLYKAIYSVLKEKAIETKPVKSTGSKGKF